MASYKVHIIDKKNGVDATVDIDSNEFILDGAERQVIVHEFDQIFKSSQFFPLSLMRDASYTASLHSLLMQSWQLLQLHRHVEKWIS